VCSISPNQTHPVAAERILDFLTDAEMAESHGLMPWSSNYTFLATLVCDDTPMLVVYKPSQGERPLWDFPPGTLALREVAAFLVAQALGWDFVPPTVLRDGLFGPGAVQLFIDAHFESHYFTLRDENISLFQRVTAFDIIVNNADRKAGHCLRDREGHIWTVDHGLTFHPEDKLRTVIWDFAGHTIPDDILLDLHRLQDSLEQDSACSLLAQLSRLLSDLEIEVFCYRLRRLVAARRFPMPGPGRNVPYPPI
jgi:uncharacterized repeat protein (TIGR03843 family)